MSLLPYHLSQRSVEGQRGGEDSEEESAHCYDSRGWGMRLVKAYEAILYAESGCKAAV